MAKNRSPKKQATPQEYRFLLVLCSDGTVMPWVARPDDSDEEVLKNIDGSEKIVGERRASEVSVPDYNVDGQAMMETLMALDNGNGHIEEFLVKIFGVGARCGQEYEKDRRMKRRTKHRSHM